MSNERPRREAGPPGELFLAASLFSAICEKSAIELERAERTVSHLLGSEVEFCDYGPGGWAIRYRGKTYHDSQFG